ncbi:hypothetical protein GCM10020255_049400 [Rhodococcus baikonurensis]
MIASWLRAHLASERILVWVSAPQPSSTLEDFWAIVLDRIHAAGIALPDIDDLADPFTAVAKSLNALSRPVLLVLIRPDLTAEPELDDQLIELLTLCHNLDLVVTLSGFGMFSEPYLLDTDHEVISASELLFTTADTAHVLEQAGVQPTDGDSEQITSLTGGLPVLVRVAVPAVRVSGTGTGNRGQMIEKNIARAIDDYVNNSVLTTAEHVKQLEFLLATAFARSITVDIAAMLFESQRPDAAETVHQIRARLAIPRHPDWCRGSRPKQKKPGSCRPQFVDRYLRATLALESIQRNVFRSSRTIDSTTVITRQHWTTLSRQRTGHWQ